MGLLNRVKTALNKEEMAHWAEIFDFKYDGFTYDGCNKELKKYRHKLEKGIRPTDISFVDMTILFDNILSADDAFDLATDALALAVVDYCYWFYHALEKIVVGGEHNTFNRVPEIKLPPENFYRQLNHTFTETMSIYISLLFRMSRDIKECSFVDLVRLVHAKTEKFALMEPEHAYYAKNPEPRDYCTGNYHIPTPEETFTFLWLVDLKIALCEEHYSYVIETGYEWKLTPINKKSYGEVSKRLYNRGASAKSILGVDASQVFPALHAGTENTLVDLINNSLTSDKIYDEKTWLIGKIEQNPLLYFDMRDSSKDFDIRNISNVDITTGYFYPDVFEDPYVKELREYHYKRAYNAACVYSIVSKYIKDNPGVKLNAMAKRVLLLLAERMNHVRYLNINIPVEDDVHTSMEFVDSMHEKLNEWGITPEDFIKNDECPLNDGRLSLDHLGEELGLSNAVRADGTPYLSIATKEERIALHMATVEAAFTDATAEAHMEGRKDAFPYNVEESAFEESNSDTLSSENNESTENKESSDSKENIYDKTIKTFYKGMRRLHPDDFEEVAQSMTKLIKLDDYVASKITPDEIKAAKTYNKYKNLKHTYTEEEFDQLCSELVEKGELNEGKAFELKYDIFTMLPPKKKVDSNADS